MVGADVTALGSGDLDGDGSTEIVVGSWLRGGTNTSLAVFDASLGVEAQIDAGYVTGLLVANLDGQPGDEVVVGTQGGVVEIRDGTTLDVLATWAAGDLNAGDHGVLFHVPADGDEPALLVVGVSGGLRVLELDASYL